MPCDRLAPGFVREELGQIDGIDWALGDAMLVASELVANAVLHSGCGPHDLIKVDVSFGRDRVMISVHDPGVSNRVAQVRTEADASGGFGLQLVQQLARDWGSEHRDGHRVWAELVHSN